MAFESALDHSALVADVRQVTAGDNPPVRLRLCTHQDHTLVEYALADLPKQIFVSKYQLRLHSKGQLQELIDEQLGAVRDA